MKEWITVMRGDDRSVAMAFEQLPRVGELLFVRCWADEPKRGVFMAVTQIRWSSSVPDGVNRPTIYVGGAEKYDRAGVNEPIGLL